MTERALAIRTDQGLAVVGLLMMLIVARLVNVEGSGRFSGFLARRAIDGVAAIGWLADHLPLSATNGGSR
jgi:hypothetical protein